MATTSSSSLSSVASFLPPRPLFSGEPICRRGKGLGFEEAKRRRPRMTTKRLMASSRRDNAHSHNFDGKLVDESMLVLRKRIKEMNMLENNYEPPKHWMEWEKQYKLANYDLDVCQAMGYLQSKLMETRPTVALGMGALLLLSFPTSMALVLCMLWLS